MNFEYNKLKRVNGRIALERWRKTDYEDKLNITARLIEEYNRTADGDSLEMLIDFGKLTNQILQEFDLKDTYRNTRNVNHFITYNMSKIKKLSRKINATRNIEKVNSVAYDLKASIVLDSENEINSELDSTTACFEPSENDKSCTGKNNKEATCDIEPFGQHEDNPQTIKMFSHIKVNEHILKICDKNVPDSNSFIHKAKCRTNITDIPTLIKEIKTDYSTTKESVTDELTKKNNRNDFRSNKRLQNSRKNNIQNGFLNKEPPFSAKTFSESFGQNYPEEFDGALDCISLAVTCAFNKRGTLLAVGCNDGRIVIWDFLTRGIAKIISAHMHPVCSLSWSRNGFKLLSASTDNNVCIWDVLSGECEQKYRFPSPILKVQFHPRNDKMFLVCPMRHAAVLVDTDGDHKIVPLDEDTDLTIVASFDRRGQHIYTGNTKGKVLVMSCPDLEVKATFRVTTSATAVRSIEFARRGDCFLVNTADRVIRVYNSNEVLACGKDGEPEPIQKLQDLVNKMMWKKCCFSGDGEYVCAGSARQHALYIWEKSIGNLVKILHGTKGELLLDVVWHPVRPIIASISSGVVSVWAQNQVENWSAFAPDFKELDENVEYEERESEFDLSDEDRSVKEDDEKEDEDLEVDVSSVDPVPAFCSSDEETEDTEVLQFLPIAPEVEDPEEGPTLPPPPPSLPLTGSPPSKRPRYQSFEINLQNAPVNEPHPLLSNRPGKDKPFPSSKKGSSKRFPK